jgi:hypothetical protein
MREGGPTCLLDAYLFESHLHQEDIDQIFHVRPFVNVGYNKDNRIILENPEERPSVSSAAISPPRGQTTDEILLRMISDQSRGSL